MKKLIIVFILSVASFSAQEYTRNILIEVFTNSHCPLCPAAHNTIEAYLANGSGADRVRFMYYHMIFPYSDDQLNQDNREDPAGRNQYYGPFSSTPRAFFDGQTQSNNYNMWDENIDARLAVNSSVQVSLSGTADGNNISIDAEVLMGQSTPTSNLVIHFVAVEDVMYNGRNGISNHKNVVRNMITPTDGESISFAGEQNIQKEFTIDPSWEKDKVTFIVFVQNNSTMEVLQSEWIDYSELNSTSVEDKDALQNEFVLYQNYPNPFNPSTTIKFAIPQSNQSKTSEVKLVLYNILGKEIKTLVNESLSAGIHEIEFNAENLSSGVYFYKLTSGKFTSVKKLTFLK